MPKYDKKIEKLKKKKEEKKLKTKGHVLVRKNKDIKLFPDEITRDLTEDKMLEAIIYVDNEFTKIHGKRPDLYWFIHKAYLDIYYSKNPIRLLQFIYVMTEDLSKRGLDSEGEWSTLSLEMLEEFKKRTGIRKVIYEDGTESYESMFHDLDTEILNMERKQGLSEIDMEFVKKIYESCRNVYNKSPPETKLIFDVNTKDLKLWKE